MRRPLAVFAALVLGSLVAAAQDGGIGASIDLKDGRLVFTRVVEGGAAAKAGVKVGDRIFTIDRWPVDGRPVAWSVQRIRGDVGAPVELALDAADGSGAKVLRLTRESRAAK